MKIPPLFYVFCTLVYMIFHCQSFEFKAVDVTPDLSYVNSLTSYTIDAHRYSNQFLDSTAWDSQKVPGGSNVVVVFPIQYTLVSPSCSSVDITIQNNLVLPTAGFICTLSGRQLTISNLFANGTFVKSIFIKLNSIINPSLAINTDSFIVRIGNDVSADTPMASVIIAPTKFVQVNATFDIKTVNTTGNLLVTFISHNLIKAGSSIEIDFPSTLQWARDISSSHPLPLNSPLSCSGLTSNIRSSINCVGSLTERSITLSNINALDVSINQTVSFKVGQLFSPPSTEEIDEIGIKVKSLYTDGFYYDTDSDRMKITGLTPKTMTVAFSSTSRVTVNAKIAIQMDIVLVDTINQGDTLRVYFPSVSNFAMNDTRSNTLGFFINSTLTTYDSTNKILQMRQRSQTQINFANKAISIQMSSFTVPPSIKQFGIKFQILRLNFTMVQGTVNTNALTTSYTGNVSGNDLGVNRVTRYDILVDVKDNHTGLMMIEIVLPTTLTVNVATFSARTSISPTIVPTVSITGTTQTTITLTNLIAPSSTMITPQIVTITLNNVTNPSSVKSIGSFTVRTYYTADLQQRVSQSTISTTLVTVNGQIAQSSVKLIPTSFVNYELTTYTLQFVIENSLEVNGYFSVNLLSELDLSQVTSVRISTSSITSQLIPFSFLNTTAVKLTNNVSRIPSNTQVTFTFANIRNPSSTRPTIFPQVRIQSFNSLAETIDFLNANNSIFVQTNTVNAMKSAKLDRNSLKNDELTGWKINLTQTQNIESGQTVILVIDNAALLPSTISCIDTVTSLNLTCIKLSSKPSSLSSFSSAKSSFTYISIQVPSSYITKTTFLFTIQSIQNPPSYLPFSILLFTTSSDLTHLYSTVEQSSQNSQLSLVGIGSYVFSKRQLKESTTLTFGYSVVSGFGSLVMDFGTTGFNITSVSCSSMEWTDMTCTVIGNSTIAIASSSISLLSPKSATITLSNLVTPVIQNTAPLYIKLNTFDLSSQPMGTNTNSISYTLECQFPCKTCTNTNASECLSCYKSSLSLKQYLGVDKKCYQQCPDGYNENVDTYTCEKCSQPCVYCNNIKTNCTKCNSTTEFVYLSYTSISDTSTCVKTCPSKYFPDTNSVPVYCQACSPPCFECKSATFCLSCLQANVSQTLYLSNGTCLSSCPLDVTVINALDKSCVACSPQCKTCAVLTTNCTTCADTSIFYLGKCLVSCPLPLIKYNSTCVPCDSKCENCSFTPSNCTSCIKTSNFSLFYLNDCLTQCPNLYYPNINKSCLECDKLAIGCKNCSGQTSCKSCDAGYVLLADRCLTTVPIGYINNSGIAVPCTGDCKTCSGTVDNCTSCKTLILNGNLCQATCNIGEIGIAQVCTKCQYPCQTCSGQIYLCASCYSNSSTFLYNSQCLTTCPDRFYKSTLNMSCAACKSPCEKCVDQSTCITCLSGFYFYANTSQCLATCPSGMVGENKLCVECQSPCITCTETKATCQSCIVGYFFSPSTNQCLNQCPSGTIKNQTLRVCNPCTSPCQTCINQTTQCVTCIKNNYLMQNQCYSQCPQYYYANSSKCMNCVLPCLTCTSETLCTTCSGALYLYRQGCVTECPKQYGKVVAGNCTQCDSGCYSCQSSGTCLQCSSGYIFYLDQCLSSCPTGYMQQKINNTLTCVIKQESDTKLQSSLSSAPNSLFPLPFTILGLIIIGAGLISKLQNTNTYLIGLAYSVFGVLQTGVVLYVLYSYFFKYSQSEILTIYLILAGLGTFVVLSVFAFFAHTIQLCGDKKFETWMKSSCSNSVAFFFTTIISLAVNYKFKLILFSKIFNFGVFKAQLISVQKFKIFNVFSFLGIFGQAELIYAFAREVLVKKDLGNDLFMTFIDGLVILALNVVFSIASSWKSQDFFTEQIDGIVINKKVFIEGDVINKEALKDQEEYHPYFSTRKTFYESRQVLKNASDVINEFNDEYSMSDQQEIETSKNSKNIKTKDQLYFEDQDLSSQTLRYKEDLDIKPSKRSQLKNNRQAVFDKGIEEQEQTEKNYNDQELRHEEQYYISSNTEDIENRSIKKSENIFCQSPRKRQKQNNKDSGERKGHYSEEEEDEKAKKIRINKEIEDSASHYNKVWKDKQTKQFHKQDTKLKRSTKSKKSRKSKQLSSSTQNKQSEKEVPSKKLILELNHDGNDLQSSHDSQYQQEEPKNTRFRFQQVSNSLKVTSQISNVLEEGEMPKKQMHIRQMKITSQNSSKTYALPLHLSPENKEPGAIDSESETVCQDGRLKPERRQNSIKEIGPQNKIKINTMHYNGEENSVNQEDAPKSRTWKPRYDKETEQQVKYDKVQERQEQEQNLPNIPILIQKNQLAQSQQSYQMQEIEKYPLGYSPQSRIIENKQDSRDFSQDEMLLQLHSHMRYEGSSLQQGKTLQMNQARHQRLQTIEQGLLRQTPFETMSKQASDPSNTKQTNVNNSLKDKYQKIITKVQSWKGQRGESKKRTLHMSGEQPVNKKPNDIYVSQYLQEGEVPIKKRERRIQRERKNPIQHRNKDKFLNNNDISGIESKTDSQFQLSPSKLSPNRRIYIQNSNLLTPIYRSNPADVIVYGESANQKDQSPNNMHHLYQSSNIEFDLQHERLNTNTIFGDDMKDELDNFSMKQINFGKNNQYVPTSFANQNLRGSNAVNLQDINRYRFSSLNPTQLLPKPNIQQFSSPINEKSPQQNNHDGLQGIPSFSITNSKSLAAYYGYNRVNREGQKSRQRQPIIVRSKSRDGTNNGKATLAKSPQKDTHILQSSGKQGKNQISSNRLRELEKIYLQRLH